MCQLVATVYDAQWGEVAVPVRREVPRSRKTYVGCLNVLIDECQVLHFELTRLLFRSLSTFSDSFDSDWCVRDTVEWKTFLIRLDSWDLRDISRQMAFQRDWWVGNGFSPCYGKARDPDA